MSGGLYWSRGHRGLHEALSQPGWPGLQCRRDSRSLSACEDHRQTQDEVFASLLSGWLLASLSGVLPSACPSAPSSASSPMSPASFRTLTASESPWMSGTAFRRPVRSQEMKSE